MSREVETKLELTTKAWEKLLSACHVLRRHEQLNVYYDSGRELASRSTTLRLRYEAHTPPTLTLKVPIGSENGCRTAIELEDRPSRVFPARQISVDADLGPEFRAYFRNMGLKAVNRIGAMRTWRINAALPSGVSIELDRVCLPGGTIFCEVEIENPDASVHEDALAEIRSIVQEFSFSRCSKFERFVRALDECRATGQTDERHAHSAEVT